MEDESARKTIWVVQTAASRTLGTRPLNLIRGCRLKSGYLSRGRSSATEHGIERMTLGRASVDAGADFARDIPGEIKSRRVLVSVSILDLIENKANAMTIEELATILSQSPKTLYKAVKKGTLPGFRLGGNIRLDPHEVAEWLRKRRTK